MESTHRLRIFSAALNPSATRPRTKKPEEGGRVELRGVTLDRLSRPAQLHSVRHLPMKWERHESNMQSRDGAGVTDRMASQSQLSRDVQSETRTRTPEGTGS